MSKGSKQRPTNYTKYSQGYDMAFGKAKGGEAQELTEDSLRDTLSEMKVVTVRTTDIPVHTLEAQQLPTEIKG